MFPGRTTDHARFDDLAGWTAANVNARRLATGFDGWKVMTWLDDAYTAATTEPETACPTCHDCGEHCPDCTPFAAFDIEPEAALTSWESLSDAERQNRTDAAVVAVFVDGVELARIN